MLAWSAKVKAKFHSCTCRPHAILFYDKGNESRVRKIHSKQTYQIAQSSETLSFNCRRVGIATIEGKCVKSADLT